MKYARFKSFSNIKLFKNRAINDTTLQKIPYFCSGYKPLTTRNDEKNDTDDTDAGMWHDHVYGSETSSDQV